MVRSAYGTALRTSRVCDSKGQMLIGGQWVRRGHGHTREDGLPPALAPAMLPVSWLAPGFLSGKVSSGLSPALGLPLPDFVSHSYKNSLEEMVNCISVFFY